MGEISNKSLALLVLAALVVVVVATSVQVSTLNGLTGFAGTEDTGIVNLSIGTSVSIDVVPPYDTINFGECTPNASGGFWADSDDGVASVNCTGDTATDQHIEITNIGNVDANVTVAGECTVAAWVPESGTVGTASDNQFQVKFTDPGASCSSGLQSAYTGLSTSDITVCEELTVSNAVNMSAQVYIDADTQNTGSCGGNSQNTITFTAAQSGV